MHCSTLFCLQGDQESLQAMAVGRPRLCRKRAPPKPAIVHLGLGAFFRSHGALVIEDAMKFDGKDWGVVGVSLQSPRIRDSLLPQGNIYTAVELGPKGRKDRVCEVLNSTVFAPENPDGLLELMADPAIKIVSLTVTEKGYCHIPSTGVLNTTHPEIKQDIQSVFPTTAVGYIVRALERRRDAGIRPFTVLSCDNLPDNGRIVRNVVIGLAECIDQELSSWLTTEGRFPSTMVDRIVPATTANDIEQLASDTGYQDLAPVFHEPFCQWVIEDCFVNSERPALEQVPCVQLVSDVAPFEEMKIRMLNGTHSALAYLGFLAGYDTVAETLQDPAFLEFVKNLWSEEIIPTVTPPEDVDLSLYADQLLERYANTGIKHRTWQIAMDGSQKLPQRILGTIADNQRAGRSCYGLILAVAAWMHYVGGVDEKGNLIDVRDPLSERLRNLSAAGKNAGEKVKNLLSEEDVFEPEIAKNTMHDLVEAYLALEQLGARESVKMNWIPR